MIHFQFLKSPMIIAGETKVLLEERFICILISRFISLIFLSTLNALNILSLYQLFRDIEIFMSLFGCFQFWVSTFFLEVICPRYGPDCYNDLVLGKCKQMFYWTPNHGQKVPLNQHLSVLLSIFPSILSIFLLILSVLLSPQKFKFSLNFHFSFFLYLVQDYESLLNINLPVQTTYLGKLHQIYQSLQKSVKIIFPQLFLSFST